MRKPTPKSKDIRFILKNGKKRNNEYFTIFTLDTGKTELYTANISKKAINKSVDRNLYKRRIKSAFHKHKEMLKGNKVLIMPKPAVQKLVKYSDIERNLLKLFKMM